MERPEVVRAWHEASNNLVLVTVENEDGLLDLLDEVCELVPDEPRPPYSATYEPDLDDALTAIAIGPSARARRITSDLPLALRVVREGVNA